MRNFATGMFIGAALTFGPGMATAQDGAITLQITFDAATSEALIGLGEWVTVSAYYFGDATSADAPTEEDGSVYLGGETLQIFPVSQVVTLGGGIAGMPGWSAEPMINVNIFTARFVAEDNLIDCSFVEGPVAEVRAAPNAVTCTLLGQ